MSGASSARASTEGDEDPKKRATKKVKTRVLGDEGEEVTMEDSNAAKRDDVNYCKALMSAPGLTGEDDFILEDWNKEDLLEK